MTVYDLTKSSIGNIKLGAKGGSGFVFCGKANTMNIDRLEERPTETICHLQIGFMQKE